MDRFISFILRRRWLIAAIFFVLCLFGIYSWTRLSIDAYPDIADVTVHVVTQVPGLAAEEMEQQISIPLERALNGIPSLTMMRSKNAFGLSIIVLVFEDGTEDYWARQRVMECIGSVELPYDAVPELNPLTSPTGEIYRYVLVGDDNVSLRELTDLNQWTVIPALQKIQGVAAVSNFGGLTTQYQVELDPAAISHHENMRLRVTLDARTAEIMLEVQVYNVPADMRTIYRATSSFGVPVPVSNVITPGYSDLRATQSILGGLASLAQGNIGAAVDKFGAAIGGAVEGSIPHVSSIGGPGSTAKLDGFPKLYVTHWRVSPDDLQGKGRPLCDMRTISTIPGYIQGDPDELEIPCTSTELEIIREHVRNGFHYQ